MSETKLYEALESFAIRSGVNLPVGGTVELTDDEARVFLHYGRIRLVPPVEGDDSAEVETDPDRGTAPAERRRRR